MYTFIGCDRYYCTLVDDKFHMSHGKRWLMLSPYINTRPAKNAYGTGLGTNGGYLLDRVKG
jgi:hypothetical protein